MTATISSADGAFRILDVAGEIVGFLPQGALLPASLSCRGLLAGVRRALGPDRLLLSERQHFVSRVLLVQWALKEGCGPAAPMTCALPLPQGGSCMC